MSRYHSIVPGLVTIDSDLSSVPGSYYFNDFNFFPKTNVSGPVHIKVVKGIIVVPDEYDFRNGYYIKKQTIWYYSRKFLGRTLKFSFDEKRNIFTFNHAYSFIYFEIGGILPIGKHIADIINLKLLIIGCHTVRGFSYECHGKTIAGIAPSFNGKTNLLEQVVRHGGMYIAEDILIVNFSKMIVYPTSALSRNYGRGTNKKLAELLVDNKELRARKIDEFILMINRTSEREPEAYTNSSFIDYYHMNAELYRGNLFARSYIFCNNLHHLISDEVNKISTGSFLNKTVRTYNFDTSELFEEPSFNKDHWEELGNGYSKVWESKAKKFMSKNELKFISDSIKHADAKVLDIGIGNGRIINHLLSMPNIHSVYGIDIAEEMVHTCQTSIHDERLIELKVVDVSKEPIPFTGLDVVTSIRVLKYNSNWKDIIKKVVDSLDGGGIYIFTMLNKHSLNYFSRYPIASFKTTRREVKQLAKDLNIDLIDVATLTRVPDKVYELSTNFIYQQMIIILEYSLAIIFGDWFLGRELFYVMRKKQ